MFERKKYKQFAKIQLDNRRAVPLLITLITLGINFILNLPQTIYTTKALYKLMEDLPYISNMAPQELLLYYMELLPKSSIFISYLIAVVSTFITAVVTVASLNLYLKMSRSPEPVKFSDFIEGFNNWGRALRGYLWRLLWLFLWGLVGFAIYMGIILTISIFAGIFASIGVAGEALITSIIPIGVIIGLAGLYAPIIIKIIRYSQMYYLIAEFENMPVKKALNISKKITKGHVWHIIVTYLSFIGWYILCGLTNNILNLWITPYISMTFVNVYHALLKEALEKGIITAEELKNEPAVKAEPEKLDKPFEKLEDKTSSTENTSTEDGKND